MTRLFLKWSSSNGRKRIEDRRDILSRGTWGGNTSVHTWYILYHLWSLLWCLVICKEKPHQSPAFNSISGLMSVVLMSLLTIRDGLGPAGVWGRVVVHQIQVDPSHHAVQLGSLVCVAVSGEEIVCDRLSSHQVVTERGKMIIYWQYCCDFYTNFPNNAARRKLSTFQTNCRRFC